MKKDAKPLQLEQAAGLLHRILDTIADPLFVKDEEHRWIVVNQAFCDFMGHGRDEIIGKSDFDFFPRSEAETFWQKDAEVFESGEVNINEEPFTDADGQTHVIITKKAVFTDEEGRRILVGIIRDVSELKRTQKALEEAHGDLERRVQERTREVEEAHARLHQAQKMEAVGQLTGGIAHDFNNLLAIVMGNLEMALQSDPTPALRHLIEPAMEATRRGATLTQRLLAFSRRQALQPRPTDVCRLIDGMLDLLRRSLGEAVQVEVTHGDAPMVALIDPTQLESAILNLAINARDAMPAGGMLRLAVADVIIAADHAVDGLSAGPHVVLEVSDTGEGMSKEVLQHVFEPFFSTKADNRGSGLGLSMVYGFIHQSRGHVSVESTPGVGSLFRILLPRTRLEPDAGQPSVSSLDRVSVRGTGQQILVVEDDPGVRAMTVMLLRGQGYDVLEATSEASAKGQIRELGDLRLLLTDVVLTGAGRGDRLAAWVEAHRPELPVLFMSGYPKDVVGPRVQEFRLLPKPFTLGQLASAVHYALSRGGVAVRTPVDV
ncbi:MAG: ATP-binding protein [Myxococcales bacterium]|nr:ATP-binding protein [Myxococcales bacterium]